MKIHSVGAELFHVEGQTDVTKLMVTFCNFADMPKNATATGGAPPDGYSGKRRSINVANNDSIAGINTCQELYLEGDPLSVSPNRTGTLALKSFWEITSHTSYKVVVVL
jgi:hypothetical protein